MTITPGVITFLNGSNSTCLVFPYYALVGVITSLNGDNFTNDTNAPQIKMGVIAPLNGSNFTWNFPSIGLT